MLVGVARVAEPVEERGDAGLRDQPDPATGSRPASRGTRGASPPSARSPRWRGRRSRARGGGRPRRADGPCREPTARAAPACRGSTTRRSRVASPAMTDDGAPCRAARPPSGSVRSSAFWVLVVVGGSLQPGYDPAATSSARSPSDGARAPLRRRRRAPGLRRSPTSRLPSCSSAGSARRLGAALLVGAAAADLGRRVRPDPLPGRAAYCGLPRRAGTVLVGRHRQPVRAASARLGGRRVVRARRGRRCSGWRCCGGGAAAAARASLSAAALVTSLATVPFWLGSTTPGGRAAAVAGNPDGLGGAGVRAAADGQRSRAGGGAR